MRRICVLWKKSYISKTRWRKFDRSGTEYCSLTVTSFLSILHQYYLCSWGLTEAAWQHTAPTITATTTKNCILLLFTVVCELCNFGDEETLFLLSPRSLDSQWFKQVLRSAPLNIHTTCKPVCFMWLVTWQWIGKTRPATFVLWIVARDMPY